MTRILVTCARCGMHVFLRDNGYEDPPRPPRCPFCGSSGVHRTTDERTRSDRPREAA
jgi:hypothetical protein